MNKFTLMSDVIMKIDAITSELNCTETAIKTINERIAVIYEGYEQSGRCSDYFYRFQNELEIAKSDKLGFEHKRDRLITELSVFEDLINEYCS